MLQCAFHPGPMKSCVIKPSGTVRLTEQLTEDKRRPKSPPKLFLNVTAFMHICERLGHYYWIRSQKLKLVLHEPDGKPVQKSFYGVEVCISTPCLFLNTLWLYSFWELAAVCWHFVVGVGWVHEQTHFFKRSFRGLVTFREICSDFLRNPDGDGEVTSTFV